MSSGDGMARKPVETEPDAAFWRYSVGLYGRADVSERCLRLQDQHGCDVNLILFALWSGLSQGALSHEAAEAVVGLCRRWGARAVQPLRAIRRDLKSGVDGIASEAFREAVKRLELEAEKLQQHAMARMCSCVAPAGLAAAERNLILCLELSGVDADKARPDWAAILSEAECAERGDLEP